MHWRHPLSRALSLAGLVYIFSFSATARGEQAAQPVHNSHPFEKFHAQSLSTASIKLDDAAYRDITSVPRDYAVAVLLTALESRYGCQLCREFQPEWDLLARSWVRGDRAGESRLLFASLDYDNGKETYQALHLQTAPVLLLFPPTTGLHSSPTPEPIRYDFTSGAATAEYVHSWLARHLPDRPHPAIRRPVNWIRVGSSVTIALGVLTLGFVAWPYILPVISNRNLWAAGSLIAILLFTSGHMFNHIRKVPYVAANQQGGLIYFAGGFQTQLGLETQIVAAIYGILAFAAITLAVKAPRIMDPTAQYTSIVIWTGVMFVVYSFLLSVFRIKNGGYPFSLPPFM